MSRAFDAKQHALKAYPDDVDSGIELFLDFLGISRDDFEYAENQKVEEYLYGPDASFSPKKS